MIGHSDEVIAARRLPTGHTLPQEAAREVQVSVRAGCRLVVFRDTVVPACNSGLTSALA